MAVVDKDTVSAVINAAADEVLAAAGSAGEQPCVSSILDLVVNATLWRLFDNPSADLAAVVAANYPDASYSEVLEWLTTEY